MIPTRYEGRHTPCQAAHLYRHPPIAGGVIAQLAVDVRSPAFDAAGRGERAEMVPACRSSCNTALQGGYPQGRVLVAETAVAHLTGAVAPPTLDDAGGGQRTGMGVARCNGSYAASQANHIDDGCVTSVACPIPQLAFPVGSPAFDAASVHARTSVVPACCDGICTAGQAAHGHRRRTTVVGRSIAQLAIAVVSPAFDAAGAGSCASVQIPSRNGRHAASQAAHTGWCRSITGGVVPQLAIAVVSPTADGTGCIQCTGVEAARGNGDYTAGQAAHIDRRRTAAGCSIA